MGRGLGFGLLLLAGLCLSLRLACAQNELSAAVPPQFAGPAEIRHVNEYWRLTGEEQAVPRPIDVTLTSFFYDSDWKNLWGEQDGEAVYLPLSAITMPFKSGDRVHIKGMISSKGLVPEHDGITLLPPIKTSDPIQVGSAINDWGRLNAKLTTIEGWVEYQFEKDATHTGLVATVNGFKVTVWILRDSDIAVPNYEGATIRFTGVYQRKPGSQNQLPVIEVWVARSSDIIVNPQIEDARKTQAGKDSIEAPNALPRLLNTEQVQELGLEKAAKHYPVRLNAIVTWSHPDADFFFIQDSSGGVRVEAQVKDRDELKTAHRVEIVGETIAGAAAPVVSARNVQMDALITLPNPKLLTLEQAMTGISEAELVEMTGFLHRVSRDGNWLRLEITTPTGNFSALLPSGEKASHMANSVISVKGVCSATVNERGRVTGIELWVRSAVDITILGSMPADPFSIPRQPLSNLGKFGVRAPSNEWVCTRGTVTLHEPGHHLSIQDGSDSLRVLSRSNLPLSVGDEVEVVGLPGREQNHYILREAVYRKTSAKTNIQPVELFPPYATNDELDWCLVRLEGELLDRSDRPGTLHLVLRSGTSIFECELKRPPIARNQTQNWVPGTLLGITGVYSVRYNEYFQPQDFRLVLRSPEDVRVLKPATWWTAQRAITTASVLAFFSLMGIFWVVLLRQKVNEQTSIIRSQMEKESLLVAELERSSRLESLGVLAGGIAHDFNNLLTVIIGNVGLARMDSGVETAAGSLLAEAESGAQRARALSQQLLTFAKGGNPVRRAQHIDPIVRNACMQAIGQAKINCSQTFPPELWPAIVDKDQIAQVIHNLVINAVQAMPGGGRLSIEACNEELDGGQVPNLVNGKYVRITFTDSGPGIPAENLGKIFDPYFTTKGGNRGLGLATVRSIVRKHEGHVEASSLEGVGACFTLWLPAASEKTTASADRGRVTQPKPHIEKARILFMDDEEPIQRLAAALFRRMGCEYALASDGGKALGEFVHARESGNPFDLVITDLTVPNGMGGKELIAALKQIDPHVHAIVSSGYSSDPVLANYRDYGFLAVVTKPYLIEELEKAIRAALHTAPHTDV